MRRHTQILDARIGAGADENLVDGNRIDRHVGVQPHVLQGALDGLALDRIGFPGRIGNLAANRHNHFRRRPPGHLRLNVFGTQIEDAIKVRALIAAQGSPVSDSGIPAVALRRKIASPQIVDRHLVDRDEAHARTGLDRHVAQRHAPFHRQSADGAAAKLDRVAGTARRTDMADDRQRDILGRHALAEPTLDADQHRPGFLLQQTLRRQHMLDFRSADAKRHTGERAMRAGMRIATNHRHSRQRRAILRPNHVDDALTPVLERKIGERTGFADVRVQRLDLKARHRILDAALPTVGRRIVIGGRHNRRNAPGRTPGQLEAFEGLRTRHFMNQMAVDVNQRRAIGLFVNDMAVPKFLVQIFRHRSITRKAKYRYPALHGRTGHGLSHAPLPLSAKPRPW